MSDGSAITKDASILAFLRDADLERRNWVVIDHWEADRFAIGIGRQVQSERIAYVSTWNKSEDRFYLELEVPDSIDPIGYISQTVIEECGIKEALAAIEEHLA